MTPSQALVEAMERRDWDAVGQLVSDDVVYELPQTRERTRGREGYLRFNREYPDGWHLQVQRAVEQGDTAAVWFRDTSTGQDALAVHELRDGQIARITEWWPDAYQPPAGREHLVERY